MCFAYREKIKKIYSKFVKDVILIIITLLPDLFIYLIFFNSFCWNFKQNFC